MAPIAGHHGMSRCYFHNQTRRCIANMAAMAKSGPIHIHRLFSDISSFQLTEPCDASTPCVAGSSSSYSDVLGCPTRRHLFLFVPSLIVMPGEHGLDQNI